MPQKQKQTAIKKIWTLRADGQRAKVARLMFLGWNTQRIATALKCTAQQVRDLVATVEFQTAYAQYEREQLTRLDKKMGRLLLSAVITLAKMLKHPDWRARDAAIEKIMRVHGKYIERLDLTGTLDHTGAIAHLHQASLVLPPADDLNPDQRRLMRELLTSYRAAHPKALPAAVLKGGELQDHEATTS